MVVSSVVVAVDVVSDDVVAVHIVSSSEVVCDVVDVVEPSCEKTLVIKMRMEVRAGTRLVILRAWPGTGSRGTTSDHL